MTASSSSKFEYLPSLQCIRPSGYLKAVGAVVVQIGTVVIVGLIKTICVSIEQTLTIGGFGGEKQIKLWSSSVIVLLRGIFSFSL
ncbi:unnamed protein product [Rotaria sp. Silwood1]|nr:unnamed protein product [Rotaria sp. Silwood1]CAF4865934.1 unnamed protein product [Rotaria sp. Silwood1]